MLFFYCSAGQSIWYFLNQESFVSEDTPLIVQLAAKDPIVFASAAELFYKWACSRTFFTIQLNFETEFFI